MSCITLRPHPLDDALLTDIVHRRYVKLLKNFRSHEAILSYPNKCFYESELEVYGKPAQINAFIGSPQLETPDFPVVFHSISGEDEREEKIGRAHV